MCYLDDKVRKTKKNHKKDIGENVLQAPHKQKEGLTLLWNANKGKNKTVRGQLFKGSVGIEIPLVHIINAPFWCLKSNFGALQVPLLCILKVKILHYDWKFYKRQNLALRC